MVSSQKIVIGIGVTVVPRGKAVTTYVVPQRSVMLNRFTFQTMPVLLFHQRLISKVWKRYASRVGDSVDRLTVDIRIGMERVTLTPVPIRVFELVGPSLLTVIGHPCPAGKEVGFTFVNLSKFDYQINGAAFGFNGYY